MTTTTLRTTAGNVGDSTHASTGVDAPAQHVPVDHSGRWPFAAFLAGVGAFVAPVLGASRPDQSAEAAESALGIYQRISGNGVGLHLGMDLALIATLALAVFAVGFLRLLAPRAPDHSLTLPLARLGLGAAVTLSLSVTMLKMAFRGGLPDHGDSPMYAPESIGVLWPFVEQLSYTGLWPLVLTMGAVAVLAVRHRTLPRWYGWLSGVVAVLTLVMALGPGLPYFSGLVGPVWLVTSGVVALRVRRAVA